MSLQELVRKLDADVYSALKKCQDLGISPEKVILGKPETPQVNAAPTRAVVLNRTQS